MGLTKEEWQGLHNLFAILFVVFAVLHLFFNWKVLMSYFKSKAVEGIRLKRELALATAITGIFCVIAIWQIQPFWKLMEWREDIKHWERGAEISPPPSHVQDMTITEIAGLLNIPVEEMLHRIEKNGYVIEDAGVTLAVLAEQNNTTSEKLSSNIMDEEELQLFSGSGGGRGAGYSQTDTASGRNYGRKTVGELCMETGINVDEGIKKLQNYGIKAKSNDRIRDLAAKYNLIPSDIARYLEKK